jgi:hypothetical protein
MSQVEVASFVYGLRSAFTQLQVFYFHVRHFDWET